MSTLPLTLPVPARASTPPSTRPADARTQPTRQDEPAKPARFDRAMEQAHKDQASPTVSSDAPTPESTPAHEAPLLPCLSAALAVPQVTAPSLQTPSAEPTASDAHSLAQPDAPTTASAVQAQASPATTIVLSLDPRMSTAAQPRAPQPAALPIAASSDVATDADARASAWPSSSAGNSATVASSQKPQATAALPNNALSGTERASATPAQAQALPTWASAMTDATPQASTPPVTLPSATPTQWREPLLNALGDRVQWQLQRGQEQAVIRLEPPNLGRVEIHIRQDANGLHVHLSATHREVAQQLQSVSDQLRTELSMRHAGDVAVAVADQGRDTDGRQRSRGQTPDQEQTPGRALGDASVPAQQRTAFAMSGPAAEGAGA